jgi:hypothetical protein
VAVKILTCHEPWAWSFFDFGAASKDVENRSYKIPGLYHGPLAIHVSRKQLKVSELDVIDEFIVRATGNLFSPASIPPRDKALRGHVIGTVDVIGCIDDSQSRWAMPGYYHWCVTNQRRVRPVPIIGQQGMFERDLELEYL